MALVHIGIDLAWGQKNRTGLAAVGGDGRLLASSSARTDDEIVDWIERHAPQPGVVAIDAPLIVTNETGRRPCESLIHATFGKFDASPHSTNLGKPEFRPPRGAVLAERLGVPIDPGGPRVGVAIEVYPHPAMVGLWQLDLILKYKHKTKYPFAFRKAEFGRLLQLLEDEATLQVDALPRWADVRAIAEQAAKHSDLNAIEDEVDGIVCGWLAWLWARADARLEVYGDVERGYIVAPSKPIHGARPRAERIGPTRRVQLAGDDVPTRRATPAAAGDPITAPPAFLFDGPTGRHVLTPDEARFLEAALGRQRAQPPEAKHP